MPRGRREQNAVPAVAERQRLDALLLGLQRDRITLTCAMMQLRDHGPVHRPRVVLGILVALLRLQRSNRRAMAALRLTERERPA